MNQVGLYDRFLASKEAGSPNGGFEMDAARYPQLDPHQAQILPWGCQLGTWGLFWERGLGKSLVELIFALESARHAGKPAVLVAPLAVAAQMAATEAPKFGIPAKRVRHPAELDLEAVNVTHYDIFVKWDDGLDLGAVIYDESQILRDFSGKMRKRLTVQMLSYAQLRCVATATALPNTLIEIGNQSAALGVLASRKMLARYFVADQKQMGSQVLKKKGRAKFFEWVAGWASVLRSPADLGFDDSEFRLPPLTEEVHVVPVDQSTGLPSGAPAGTQGQLFRSGRLSVRDFHVEGRLTARARAERAAEVIAADPGEPWVVWADTNYDADAFLEVCPDFVEIRGSMSDAEKEAKIIGFGNGEFPWLLTKMSICGYGMNWQHVAHTLALAPSFSWEQRYQGIGRFHRRGQRRHVFFHAVVADTQLTVHQRMQRKGLADAAFKTDAIAASVRMQRGLASPSPPAVSSAAGPGWECWVGDAVRMTLDEDWRSSSELLKQNGGYVDFSVHSPPFGEELYIYNDSPADGGNCETPEQFHQGYRFMVDSLYDLTRPGRICCVHIKDTAAYINKHGYSGVTRLSADVRDTFIRQFWECIDCYLGQYVTRRFPAMERCPVCQSRNVRLTGGRWVEVSPAITIWTDPVREQEKTKNHRLLHKTAATDSANLRVGIPEYVLVFQRWPAAGEEDLIKPVRSGYQSGEFPVRWPRRRQCDDPDPVYVGEESPEHTDPLRPGGEDRDHSIRVWQRYASPVWFDLNRTETLNVRAARDPDSARHICPTPLDLYRRLFHLYTVPGDLGIEPYSGLGSGGVCALEMGRRWIALELNETYAQESIKSFTAAKFRQMELTA